MCVRQDPWQAVLDDRNCDVRGPQVDADDCAGACRSAPAPAMCRGCPVDYLSSAEGHSCAACSTKADLQSQAGAAAVHMVTWQQTRRLRVSVDTPAAVAGGCGSAATRCIKRTSAPTACCSRHHTLGSFAGESPLLMAPASEELEGGRELSSHYSENFTANLSSVRDLLYSNGCTEICCFAGKRQAWHARAGAGGEAVQRLQRAAVVLQRQAAVDRDEAMQPRQVGVVVVQLGAEPDAAHTDASDGRSDS